jgi:hypothetical protein
MSELTFAELGFLLRACPDSADLVRAALRLTSDSDSDIVVAAGLASLLARGLLLRADDGEITPSAEVSVVIACLSAPAVAVSALGWVGERHLLTHLFGDARCRMAVYPRGLGRFAVEALDPAEPVSAVLSRFLDACVAGGGPTAVLVRSARSGVPLVSVAIDPSGVWRLSDSVDTPDRSVPVDPAGVRRRFAELFDTDPVLVSS